MNESISRREFISKTGAAISASALLYNTNAQAQSERPNILWITSEDNGPHLGCYGYDYANTPNLDKLAEKSTIYTKAWSTAPVCAPARTTIITGVYPTCTGAEHMRSTTELPDFMKMYPQYLREAGYYCTNNSKEDYNHEKPGKVWDDSSGKAHWRNREEGQPFFSIFNFTTTHESQIRRRPHEQVHDPEEVDVPAYHPDTPEVRQDWAQYHDKMTEMDAQAGEILKQLEEDGLTENTIVFYYGDHGPGMPRSKRWPYNSGLHVPMIVHIPEKFKHLRSDDYQTGGQSNRLVGFIDLAPTVLSLVGIKPPDYMQGHAFQGEYTTEAPDFAYGFRGRMDERYDLVRVARDQRYIYIRNYMPHKIYGQFVSYMFQTPTTQVWHDMYHEGKLEPPKTYFWETKPPEELYDLQEDPDEVNNLANSPEHQQIKNKLRTAQQNWCKRIRDIGFLPEGEIHERSEGTTPYEMGHSGAYPMSVIFSTAELASNLKEEAIPELLAAFHADDSAVRYWAAMGMLMREERGYQAGKEQLRDALQDPSPYVRTIAAETLAQYGNENDLEKSLDVLVKLAPVDENNVFVSMLALNAIDQLGEKASHLKDTISKMPREATAPTPGRFRGYPGRLIQKITSDN